MHGKQSLPQVTSSFEHAPGLAQCRIVLVCDGYTLTDDAAQERHRRGLVGAECARQYEEYKSVLQVSVRRVWFVMGLRWAGRPVDPAPAVLPPSVRT